MSSVASHAQRNRASGALSTEMSIDPCNHRHICATCRYGRHIGYVKLGDNKKAPDPLGPGACLFQIAPRIQASDPALQLLHLALQSSDPVQ